MWRTTDIKGENRYARTFDPAALTTRGWVVCRAAYPALRAEFGSTVDIFIYAIVAALLVTVVGFAGSLVLQGVGTPTTGTLTSALVLALIFAALTLVEPVTAFVSSITPGIRREVYPLVGAVLGYFIKR